MSVFRVEDGGSMFLRNVDFCSYVHTSSPLKTNVDIFTAVRTSDLM
jgi:hypothetical protein